MIEEFLIVIPPKCLLKYLRFTVVEFYHPPGKLSDSAPCILNSHLNVVSIF